MRQIHYELLEQSKDSIKSVQEAALKQAKEKSGYAGEIIARIDIPHYLIQSRPNIHLESIDTTQEMVNAYCDPGVDRAWLFQRMFDRLERQVDSNHMPELARARVQDDISLSESLRNGKISGAILPNVEEDKAFLCTRNPNWINKMLSVTDQKTRFYALGLGHLLPRSDGQHPCDDLLTMLKIAGMTVTLVK